MTVCFIDENNNDKTLYLPQEEVATIALMQNFILNEEHHTCVKYCYDLDKEMAIINYK